MVLCVQYEYNKVFAGRNWNNGETVGEHRVFAFRTALILILLYGHFYCSELVLRGVSGSFLPTSWLMNTLCHEVSVKVYDFLYLNSS